MGLKDDGIVIIGIESASTGAAPPSCKNDLTDSHNESNAHTSSPPTRPATGVRDQIAAMATRVDDGESVTTRRHPLTAAGHNEKSTGSEKRRKEKKPQKATKSQQPPVEHTSRAKQKI